MSLWIVIGSQYGSEGKGKVSAQITLTENIDSNAMFIETTDRDAEIGLGMNDRLSSTQSGVGSAVARRALRQKDVRLARDVKDD